MSAAAPASLRRRHGLALLLGLLTGCASQKGVRPTAFWSGRLALRFPDDPSQSLSANFELSGNARAGQFRLLTALGTGLAEMAWTDRGATLTRNQEVRQFSSLQAMAHELTGTPLPVAALFDWLTGRDARDPDWQADLSKIREGRLFVRRLAPATELRLILDSETTPP